MVPGYETNDVVDYTAQSVPMEPYTKALNEDDDFMIRTM
jgi:hypothetical protein